MVDRSDIVKFSPEVPAMHRTGSDPDVLKMRALLLTADEEIGKLFETLFSRLKLVTQYCNNDAEAQAQIFNHKFETVVLDFDTFPGVLPTRERLQRNRANKNLVVFAVATGEAKRTAMEYGARFVFERPIEPSHIAQVLRAAYGLMLRDRREYFRLAIELTVSVRRNTGEVFNCKTMNLSRSGMAMSTPYVFEIGEDIELNLKVDEIGLCILGIGKIIWDDRHGKAGVCFRCTSPEQYESFSSWLDNRFYAQFDLPENS